MTSPERIASHGRGGAGNIGKDASTGSDLTDLVTPTLKSDHYTTGRGGSGNMARNDPNHPELARASQDVEAPPHREAEGPHHYGRGGAANIAKPTPEEARAAQEHKQRTEDAAAGKGLVEKGKEFISKLGGKK
ncbi:hypothetical protein K458DRAFT_417636 [Lentithecium fluviatile CBS 122367]|uniref:Uncharacterized protein n=1 Tax=Lentithecium fluviatile CBS 122367 TaxID=1168545 RepID=A0A6G1J3H9_9PLEO|nr:hypothetical protein K458DRAFT_417636 [Lentithecium fluviatile CBS 122367]